MTGDPTYDVGFAAALAREGVAGEVVVGRACGAAVARETALFVPRLQTERPGDALVTPAP